MNPVTAKRAHYDSLRNQYPGSIITESYLRLETPIEGTFTNIAFNVLANQGTPTATEQRLQIADGFVITKFGFTLLKVPTTTTAAPTAAQQGAAQIYSYPNATAFSQSGQAANLLSIYNGYLSFRYRNTVYMESYAMQNFYSVPTSQEGTTTAVYYNSGATTYTIAKSGWQPETSMVSIEPTMKISGTQKIDININLPASVNLAGSGSGSQTVACLWMKGFKVANGARAFDKEQADVKHIGRR